MPPQQYDHGYDQGRYQPQQGYQKPPESYQSPYQASNLPPKQPHHL